MATSTQQHSGPSHFYDSKTERFPVWGRERILKQKWLADWLLLLLRLSCPIRSIINISCCFRLDQLTFFFFLSSDCFYFSDFAVVVVFSSFPLLIFSSAPPTSFLSTDKNLSFFPAERKLLRHSSSSSSSPSSVTYLVVHNLLHTKICLAGQWLRLSWHVGCFPHQSPRFESSHFDADHLFAVLKRRKLRKRIRERPNKKFD